MARFWRWAMRALKTKMLEDLALRGMSPETARQYVGAVRGFAQWHCRSPEQMGLVEIRQYLLHLREVRVASPSKRKLAVAGIKFLYGVTLARPDVVATLPWPRVPYNLPEIMSENEVARLLGCARDPRVRVMLMLAYAAGLRITEVCRLQVADIDSKRGVIRIRQGKGARDRETLLPATLLAELRRYWLWARPSGPWLFPARKGHAGQHAAGLGFRLAAARAGITRNVTFHSLRHAFATHLLSRGVEMRVLQVMMGHRDLKTTSRYAFVRTDLLAKVPDLLAGFPISEQKL